MKIIDISQEIRENMTVFPGDPRFHSRPCSSFRQGDICEVSEMTIGSHCGTHIDAPLHMIPGGTPVGKMPLEAFVGPCRVCTCSANVITEKMLADFGVQEGDRILLRTDTKGEYTGKSGNFNPAVLSMRAAQYLAEKHVKLVGIDAPTVENMEICDGEVHRTLLNAGIAILEGLVLESVTKEKYFLSAAPLPMVDENGAPCRALLIEE